MEKSKEKYSGYTQSLSIFNLFIIEGAVVGKSYEYYENSYILKGFFGYFLRVIISIT